MKPYRTIVVGGGHLGTIHTRLASTIDDLSVVGVVEPNESARATLGKTLGVDTFGSLDEIPGPIDAAIVATPTASHAAVVSRLLCVGAHVLVEKPITIAACEGRQLARLAREAKRTLQVGHVERFNPAFTAVEGTLGPVKYIDATRTSGYTFRSTDVGVVLDLMIHDIDLVLAQVSGTLEKVDALGVSVFGPHEDMAQARLTFSCGAVANLTASRTSFTRQRKMQIFGERGFASVDMDGRTVSQVTPEETVLDRSLDVGALSPDEKATMRDGLFESPLCRTDAEHAAVNAILDEQQDFVTSLRTGVDPRVTGESGAAAVEVAEKILEAIAAHRWDGTADGRIGPGAMPTPALQRSAA